MSENRSDRVIPLAMRLVKILKQEPDVAVQLAAYDVVKTAVDVWRFDAKRKDVNAMKRTAMERLSGNK